MYFKTSRRPPSANAAKTRSLSCNPCSMHKANCAGVSISEIFTALTLPCSKFEELMTPKSRRVTFLNDFETFERKKRALFPALMHMRLRSFLLSEFDTNDVN